MLNPIVGTEMCLRSSLFLKKFTIVDLPELLRPIIKMLICFGFLSLFKIFINNFSKTIFTFFAAQPRSAGMFIFGSKEISRLIKIFNTSLKSQNFTMTHTLLSLNKLCEIICNFTSEKYFQNFLRFNEIAKNLVFTALCNESIQQSRNFVLFVDTSTLCHGNC